MPPGTPKIGRPKSANPRKFFACRLPLETIEGIKAEAKKRKTSEANVLVEWERCNRLGVVTIIDDPTRPNMREFRNSLPLVGFKTKGSDDRKIEYVAPQDERAAKVVRAAARNPILKPKGKIS